MLSHKTPIIHFIIVVITMLIITTVIYITETRHIAFYEFYRYLYYIPIIYAGYFWGLNGGFSVSLIATTLFIPILVNILNIEGFSENTIGTMITILFFNVAAYAFGILGGKQRSRRKLYKTLLDLSEIFNKELSVKVIAQSILEESTKLFNSEGGLLCCNNIDTGKIEIEASVSLNEQEIIEAYKNINEKYTIINWLLEQDKGRINNDIRHDKRFDWDDDEEFIRTTHFDNFMSVPISSHNKLIGVIFLFNCLDGDYKNEHLELLSMLAERGGLAMENANLYEVSLATAEENARLYHRTQKANKDLKTLRDAGLTMSAASVLNLNELSKIIIELACKFVDADKGSIMLSNIETNELEVKAVIRLDKETVIGEKRKMGDGLSGMVYTNRKPLLVENIEKTIEFKYHPRPQYFTNSFIIIPLETENKALGVLNVADKKSGESFTEDDLALLIALSSSASIAIENATLYENLSIKERMEQELKIATSIQTKLLPKKMPKIKGIEVYGTMIAAREIGGDYFDFVQREDSDKELNICIGDVSGKGLPAGLIMVMTRTLIRSLIQTHISTNKIISKANKLLNRDIDDNKFITILLMHWNSVDEKLHYSSGGHEHIIIYRAAKKKCDVYKSGGLAIGIIPELPFDTAEKELSINYGDTIILYTDGVTEARNEQNDMFSLEKLVETVEKYGEQNITILINSIYNELQIFMGKREQFDDITLVGVKRVREKKKKYLDF